MSKTLAERLQDARTALDKVDGVVARHAGRLASDIEMQFKAIAAFASNVDHWNQMLVARQTARALLTDLEQQADQNDDVPYGASKAKFQTVRLLGVQSYLAAQWALADRLVGMAGQVCGLAFVPSHAALEYRSPSAPRWATPSIWQPR